MEKSCPLCGREIEGSDSNALMINYNRHSEIHKNNAARLSKLAVVVRGPPSTGKTATCNRLACFASKLNLKSKQINLDSYDMEGFIDDNVERTYPNLDGIKEDWALIEIGYGGYATKRPQTWVSKLKAQGFRICLFKLWADEVTTINRSNKRTDGMNADAAMKFWQRYKGECEFIDFPAKAGLQENEIDTSQKDPLEVVHLILDKLGI
jgi:hypothetical protein